ncbi:MAG: glycosyltransferase family 4 protein, partial [bacterium]
ATMLNRSFHRQVFISPRQRDHFLKTLRLPLRRTTVIANGVNTDRFRPRETPRRELLPGVLRPFAKILGMVGSFQPRKGVGLFLEMAARLAHARSDVGFLLIGAGDVRREKLLRAINQRGLDDRTAVLPPVEDIEHYYPLMTALVQPSFHPKGGHAETLPLTVMEAMSCGIAVLASRVGAVEDLVTHGHSGLLSPPGQLRELLTAADEILSSPQIAERLGKRARLAICQKYDEKGMIGKYERLFRQIQGAA